LLIAELSEQLIQRASATDSSVGNILKQCQTLFLLHLIDKQSIFLRYNCLSPPDAQKLHRVLVELCMQLREQALPLVDSFGIPPHLLAPIAFDWIEHNSRSFRRLNRALIVQKGNNQSDCKQNQQHRKFEREQSNS